MLGPLWRDGKTHTKFIMENPTKMVYNGKSTNPNARRWSYPASFCWVASKAHHSSPLGPLQPPVRSVPRNPQQIDTLLHGNMATYGVVQKWGYPQWSSVLMGFFMKETIQVLGYPIGGSFLQWHHFTKPLAQAPEQLPWCDLKHGDKTSPGSWIPNFSVKLWFDI